MNDDRLSIRAYEAGYHAAQRGIPRGNNPYCVSSDLVTDIRELDWSAGWDQGKRDEAWGKGTLAAGRAV